MLAKVTGLSKDDMEEMLGRLGEARQFILESKKPKTSLMDFKQVEKELWISMSYILENRVSNRILKNKLKTKIHQLDPNAEIIFYKGDLEDISKYR